MIDPKVKASLNEILEELRDKLKVIKDQAQNDLEIDEIDIDRAVLDTPKLFSKYNNLFADETLNLKDLYSFKEKVKLERWKYWNGKQTNQYYSENGVVHEKILKGDIDKYLSADEKLCLVNEIVSVQKAIVDHLERSLKEIGSRNFHCKSRWTGENSSTAEYETMVVFKKNGIHSLEQYLDYLKELDIGEHLRIDPDGNEEDGVIVMISDSSCPSEEIKFIAIYYSQENLIELYPTKNTNSIKYFLINYPNIMEMDDHTVIRTKRWK